MDTPSSIIALISHSLYFNYAFSFATFLSLLCYVFDGHEHILCSPMGRPDGKSIFLTPSSTRLKIIFEEYLNPLRFQPIIFD
jgi:hypothetical protein